MNLYKCPKDVKKAVISSLATTEGITISVLHAVFSKTPKNDAPQLISGPFRLFYTHNTNYGNGKLTGGGAGLYVFFIDSKRMNRVFKIMATK